jgi:hypothetical protein
MEHTIPANCRSVAEGGVLPVVAAGDFVIEPGASENFDGYSTYRCEYIAS